MEFLTTDFDHEDSSYNRHVQYCTRTRHRPRIRPSPCRSCSAAKVKCSSELRCLRCKRKGISCVYKREGLADTVHPQANPQHPQGTSNLPATPSPSSISSRPVPSSSAVPGIEDEWNAFFALSNSVTDQRRNYGSVLDQISANLWPSDSHVAIEAPATLVMSERPDVEFLSRIPRNDPVLQFTSSLVVQSLRAFPRMMMRRETFPSFIHPHWCDTAATGEFSLPEQLVNCMGIAQMFTNRNVESSFFLWRTVSTEQRAFIQNVRLSLCSQDDIESVMFMRSTRHSTAIGSVPLIAHC